VTDATGASRAVVRTDATSPQERDRLVFEGVAALLDIAIPPLSKKVVGSLAGADRLALSQSPYRRIEDLTADCTRRAIRDQMADASAAVAAVRTPAEFETVRARIQPAALAAAPEYFALAVATLRALAPVRTLIDQHAGSVAADDVAEQIDDLVFDGFVRVTGRTHLSELPRYLLAAQTRLAALPASAARDQEGVAVIDRVTQRWNQRLAQVSAARRDAVNEEAHWLVEELRVGVFAQRIGTAYPVSEKRALRTLDRLG